MAAPTPACDLAGKKCKPCEGGVPPLDQGKIKELLATLPGWEFVNGEIAKTYHFKNYYQTMAFVNALAYMAQSWPESIEGHWANVRHAVRNGIHPDVLDRAEEAILRYAESDTPRQMINLLRFKLSEDA